MPMAKRKRKLEHILLFWCLVGTRLFIRIFAGVVAVALFMNALHIVKLNERKMFTYFWTLLLHWFFGMSQGGRGGTFYYRIPGCSR